MTLGGRTAVLFHTLLIAAAPAAGQQWTADVYAGGTRYEAIAARSGAANLVGNLRVQSSRLFAYLSAAAPIVRDAPAWGALGGGARLSHLLNAGLRVGLDLDADGYVFRHDAVATGGGVTVHALPFIGLARDGMDLQLRAGRHDHRFDADGAVSARHLYEVGVRGAFGDVARFAIADVRMLTGATERYPMARLQLGTTLAGVRVWGTAGQWFGDDLSETVWGAGAGTDVGSRGELWAAVRRDAADPLYLSVSRTSWNVGFSMKLGRDAAASVLTPVVRGGAVVLRLPRSASRPAPAVAGEFSDWQPLPMTPVGDEWVIEIAPGPGVYRFAFVAPDGEWFVPEGYPGRMDDDMGGHVAVVVVP